MKVRLRLRAAPLASYTPSVCVKDVPTAASDGRLPVSFVAVVAIAGATEFFGSVIVLSEALPDGTTPLVAVQPCTSAPSGVASWPSASKVKLPARENMV